MKELTTSSECDATTEEVDQLWRSVKKHKRDNMEAEETYTTYGCGKWAAEELICGNFAREGLSKTVLYG